MPSQKHATNEEYKQVLLAVIKNQLIHSLPGNLLLYKVLEYCFPRSAYLLPSPLQLLVHLALIILIHDFLFFILHYLLHTSYLYKKYHYLHHEVRYTYSLASEYSHPMEFVLSGVIPVLVGPLILKAHFFTVCVWMVLQMCETTIAHCGYNFCSCKFQLFVKFEIFLLKLCGFI